MAHAPLQLPEVGERVARGKRAGGVGFVGHAEPENEARRGARLLGGDGRLFDDLGDDLVGGELGGLGLVGEADAVAEHVGRELLHERGAEEILTAQPGEARPAAKSASEARGEAPKLRRRFPCGTPSASMRVLRTSERMYACTACETWT